MQESVKKAPSKLKKVVGATALLVATTGVAMADGSSSNVSIDLTTGLAGVAIMGGLLSAGSLKALPTYAAWGIKKALSMLR